MDCGDSNAEIRNARCPIGTGAVISLSFEQRERLLLSVQPARVPDRSDLIAPRLELFEFTAGVARQRPEAFARGYASRELAKF